MCGCRPRATGWSADQIVGIEAHPTPPLAGKPASWLLDVLLAISIGSGTREGWGVTVLHRSLIQTSEDPGEAPVALARLLNQLNLVTATGIISTSREKPPRLQPRASPTPTCWSPEPVGCVSASFPFPARPRDTTPGPEYL
jgi:hypothetical protein